MTALGGALLLVGIVVPLPFVELAPGPTFNVIGDYKDEPVLTITGTPTFPTAGHLDMTTVNERGGPTSGINIGRVVVGWADPTIRVLPRSALFPEETRTDAEVKAENVRAFSDSQADAIAASLSYLDRPFTTLVVVSSVRNGTPADGKLEPGDQLLQIDSTTITVVEDVGKAMSTVKPGQTVTVRYEREGKGGTTRITTTASPTDPDRAFLGITIGETYEAPFTIDFSLDGVGGPSAGMMFSLGIVDKLTPGELNGGTFVAGTGTIAPDGRVGPIGGIEQKLVGARRSGATLFLAPADNCQAVLATTVPDGLTVARVSTLSDAVSAIESYVAGKPVPPCA
jgi:PDZ domain-containing protein